MGAVQLGFVPDADGGVVDWALTGVMGSSIDGLRTRHGARPAASPAAHPNRVTAIDHIVVLTPQLERTVDALEAEGVALRRRRGGETGMRRRSQAFFRLGRPILELVEADEMTPDEPARFWGITFETADLESSARALGDKLGAIKQAIQPGRRIATVRPEAGLGLPVALISPQY